MTTNTTNSQVASIADDREFNRLLNIWMKHEDKTNADLISGHIKWTDFTCYIDAKLAESNVLADKAIADVASLYDQLRQKDNAWDAMRERAEQAESRLAEIQRGVEGLRTYFIAAYNHPAYDPKFVALQDVLAILAPQGQASDTSGLPG